jgi:putative DNA primase/helicase
MNDFELKYRAARERVVPPPRQTHSERERLTPDERSNGERVHMPADFPSSATPDVEVCRLAELPTLEYASERHQAAKRLGVGVRVLDRLVKENRKLQAKAGGALNFPEPKPWEGTVSGTELLDELSAAVRRYVVLPEGAADTVALWSVHTYLLDTFGITPRLAITSPEKGCGKTTLLDVLGHLVWRPLQSANVTTAAVFRVIEMKRPTLLIDEADRFLSDRQELIGILNSGHRRGGSVLRTVGDNFEPRPFSTYSPCAIALIGKLPETLADRSVSVDLRRRRPDEPIKPFRFDRTDDLDQLARMIRRWVTDNAQQIQSAEPDMPDGLANRAADNWRSLLAIADVAGGEWPARARNAARSGRAGDDDQSVRALLLSDIRCIFEDRSSDRIGSAELIAALVAIEGRPWVEWRSGKPISPHGLARQLAPFGIVPATIRLEAGTAKGYQCAHFEDAFARYLPPRSAQP